MASSSLYKKLLTNPTKPPLLLHQFTRHLSILNPNNSSPPLSSKDKSRAALSLLKSETNPEQILNICRAASLTPEMHLDRIIFSEAISKLTQTNHFHFIRTFLSELLTRPDSQTERFYSHAIVLYGQAGLVDDALQVFDKMTASGVPRTVKSFNALLFSCILAKRYDEINRVFVEFPRKYRVVPDAESYNWVIKGFCEAGTASSGYSIIAEMERKNVKPTMTIFANWIAGFYAEEKFEDVGRVLGIMRKHDMTPNLNIYNTRIQSLCKLKKANEAKALLEGMLSRDMKPNSVTYCHLIHGFCKQGELEEAKRLFRDMSRRGLKAESDCYFTLVHFCCEAGDFEGALGYCKESIDKGWIPNFTSMKNLVKGLAGISKVDEAKELTGMMKEKFPKFSDRWSEIEDNLVKKDA